MNSEHYDELVALAWGMAKNAEEEVSNRVRQGLAKLGIAVKDDRETTAYRLFLIEQIAYRMLACMAEALVRHGPKLHAHQRHFDDAFDRHLEALGIRREGEAPPPAGGGEQD